MMPEQTSKLLTVLCIDNIALSTMHIGAFKALTNLNVRRRGTAARPRKALVDTLLCARSWVTQWQHSIPEPSWWEVKMALREVQRGAIDYTR